MVDSTTCTITLIGRPLILNLKVTHFYCMCISQAFPDRVATAVLLGSWIWDREGSLSHMHWLHVLFQRFHCSVGQQGKSYENGKQFNERPEKIASMNAN